MSLDPGDRIGPYEILSPLGAGGMGEVYRARDTRLDRTVAIKALARAFASDAERLARFEREAKLLASLNHANIAAIYGLEDAGGAPHLVLEFVEGETLARRLARGPLPLREALEIGAQIAAAIEAAHERGVVHRDLKPGNVMITPARAAKVLDFGLAKGDASEADSAAPAAAATMAMTGTADGVILGTAPYMSPEQARGRAVDRRTDVWAFGCVLWECLTGRQTFAGETVSDVLARILEREPDWTLLPGSVPPRLRDLLRRCLTKDAAERPRDIGDLGRELRSIAQELSSPSGVAERAATPSLAVLYFDNLAKDPESEYFCAGITEDILTDLSKIRNLRVASRNAVSRYRGTPVDVPRVAAELGVGAVLEGSVRRAGDRVRISVQLINATDGFQLWAERYDRTLQDVFAVQEEIASSIAEALRVKLMPGEVGSLVQNRPADVRAYDLYLRAREQYGRYTEESLHAALGLFQEAIALDPGYALGWAGIADCHGQMCQWGYTKDPAETARLGLEAAQHAIALNPRLAEAHKAESLVLRFMGDPEGARAALGRAVEANPRYTPALCNLGIFRFRDGDLAGAERLMRRTLDVDPQEAFATAWLTWLLLRTFRREAAVAAADRLRALSSEQFYVTISHALRVAVHVETGDLVAAESAIGDALADGAEPRNMSAWQAAVFARTGRTEGATRLVRELESVTALGTGALEMIATVATWLGDHEAAVRFLSRRILVDMAPLLVRLQPELHPLLDRAPFAPRRRDMVLVWPLEAPMVDAARFATFREVKVASAIPHGSDVLAD